MVPFSDNQRPSTSERHSNSTAGPSRTSSSRCPAGRGAAGLDFLTSKPASVGLHDQLASSTIAIPEDQKELYEEHIWFLHIVILQGLPGFLFLRRQLGASADWPSRNNFLSLFDLMAPKLIAYRAKYDVKELPVWAATFSLRLQELCEKPLQLADAIFTPRKFLEAKLLNFIQFKISYLETLAEVPQGHRFPQKILYETRWMVTIPPDNQPYAFHGYPADSSRFDLANDPLDNNCCFHDVTPPLVKAPTRDSSPPMRLFNDDAGSDMEFIGQAPPSPGKLHPSLFMGPRGLEPTPINPRLAYSTTNTKIPGFDGFPKLEGGRADPEKQKDPLQVEKRSNRKGEVVLMLPRPATKGVAMITEKFARPGEFQDNECVRLHVNFNSLIGSMVPLQTFPSTSCTSCIKSGLQCSMPLPESNPDSPICHPCWKSHASCLFTFPLARADEARRRLFTFCQGNNGTIGVESTALFEENTALHCQGHLVRAMVTEYYIQAENVFHRQKRLQNSTTDPRALLQGLIQDGFVEKDDIKRLSLLAFLLGWEKRFTLEDLEFEGMEFTTLQGCSQAPSPSQSRMGHLELLMDPSEPPMVPALVKKSTSKSKPPTRSPPSIPLPSSEKSSDLGNEGPPPDEAASEEESDDGAVVQGSEADASGEPDSEAEEDDNDDDEADEEADDDNRGPPSQVEEEDDIIEIADSQHESRAPTPNLKRMRSVNEEESSDVPAPSKRARMPSRKRGRVTSAPQIASDSSADVIPPKQLAKQSKTAGPSQMRVVVPQTTTTQLHHKLFKKPKTHQAEGSSSKTKLLASARIAFQPASGFTSCRDDISIAAKSVRDALSPIVLMSAAKANSSLIWQYFGGKYFVQPGAVSDPKLSFVSNIRPQYLEDKFSSLRLHLSTLLSNKHIHSKMSSEPARPFITLKDYPDHKIQLQKQADAIEVLAKAKCALSIRHPTCEQALVYLHYPASQEVTSQTDYQELYKTLLDLVAPVHQQQKVNLFEKCAKYYRTITASNETPDHAGKQRKGFSKKDGSSRRSIREDEEVVEVPAPPKVASTSATPTGPRAHVATAPNSRHLRESPSPSSSRPNGTAGVEARKGKRTRLNDDASNFRRPETSGKNIFHSFIEAIVQTGNAPSIEDVAPRTIGPWDPIPWDCEIPETIGYFTGGGAEVPYKVIAYEQLFVVLRLPRLLYPVSCLYRKFFLHRPVAFEVVHLIPRLCLAQSLLGSRTSLLSDSCHRLILSIRIGFLHTNSVPSVIEASVQCLWYRTSNFHEVTDQFLSYGDLCNAGYTDFPFPQRLQQIQELRASLKNNFPRSDHCNCCSGKSTESFLNYSWVRNELVGYPSQPTAQTLELVPATYSFSGVPWHVHGKVYKYTSESLEQVRAHYNTTGGYKNNPLVELACGFPKVPVVPRYSRVLDWSGRPLLPDQAFHRRSAFFELGILIPHMIISGIISSKATFHLGTNWCSVFPKTLVPNSLSIFRLRKLLLTPAQFCPCCRDCPESRYVPIAVRYSPLENASFREAALVRGTHDFHDVHEDWRRVSIKVPADSPGPNSPLLVTHQSIQQSIVQITSRSL
ncbi:hypothetical protein BT96DRAFT_996215 [Gymnopus androsaceus JB14]|uniref:Uncharacterized protein n=1 Tax=Gymnopus androsaceus JB14 TaxID=1447944 RepID=A0A6A4HGY6_9AGAR|nr:hypothetical protein BT96DRAFT_996215 [Gymnopus androsaceus JB14]